MNCVKQLFFVFLIVVLAPCLAVSKEKPTVFVSILPQRYFVEKLCGDFVNVEVMVLPGASPATYEPKSSQMRKLSETNVYLSIGVPFEKSWLKRIAGVNPNMTIVQTDREIQKLAMATHHHEDEHAEEDLPNSDEGLDPHIWLSPELVKKQLEVIALAMIDLLPGHQEIIARNHKSFVDEINVTDKEIQQQLGKHKGAQFMVFHPSWGYFAYAYDLKQIAVEIEGKSPKSSQLLELIKYAKENDIRVIFAQPQFSKKSAAVIAREIDGRVSFIDPLAENWLENMREAAINIETTLN